MKTSVDPSVVLAERELARRNLVDYMQYIFRYAELYRSLEFKKNWHHELIAEALEMLRTGAMPRIMLHMPPGYGKCVHPETIILSKDGPMPAKDISCGDMLYSFKDGNAVLKRCTLVEPAKKPACRISMRSGRNIIIGFDHPMLTSKGWMAPKDMSIGDRIAALSGEIDGNFEIDDHILDFVTMMIFDGNCTGKNLRFSKCDPVVVDTFLQATKELGIVVKRYDSSKCDYWLLGGGKGAATQILKRFGLYGHRSTTKRLPKDFFRLSMRQKRRIIALIFATDGYVNTKAGTCAITLANKQLIEDLQLFLATCGIVSRIYFKPNDKSNAWVLEIGRRSAKIIFKKVALVVKQRQFSEICNKRDCSLTDNYPRHIADGCNQYKARKNGIRIDNKKNISHEKFEKLADLFPHLEQFRHRDFYWDEIVSIGDIGMCDLVHIGVEETHNFIANGLVSHNTEEAVRMWVSHTIGRFPWHKFIHTTYAADLAVKNSVDTKSIMRDPAYQTLFPKVQIDRAQDEKHFWRTKEGGGMYAVGTGGAVTGFHAHTIIMDDPVKAQEAHSARANKEAFEGHYRGAMLSRLQDKKKGGILIIMQRLSDIDLAARIMKENPDEYEVISLPAIEKRPKVYEIGGFRYERAAGEPLFPEWEDLETLEKTRRALGTTTWAAQYMQEPERVEEGYYTDEDFSVIGDFDIPEQNIGIIIDPADSSSDSSDNRAIGVYGSSVSDEEELIVVHDGWFGTWNPTETIEWALTAMAKYPGAPVFIFNLGGGYTLEHNLKKEMIKRNAKLKAHGKPTIKNRISIIKHKNVRNEKNAKIEGMQPYFQMHRIKFRRDANQKFIDQLKKELKSFNPEKDSPKDDCMETLAEFVLGGHVKPKGAAKERPKEISRRKKRRGGWRV